jgi:hypothetical protein
MTPAEPIFHSYTLGEAELSDLSELGHLVLPGILTPAVCDRLVPSLSRISELQAAHGPDRPEAPLPGKYAAENDSYLASLIGHPQLIELARVVLGADIRYDHCVALNRGPGNPGMRWHTHGYSDDDTRYGFVRVFFYVNGFDPDDGGLKVVPGSHLFRDAYIKASTDEELTERWLVGKVHPTTGKPLRIERLGAPPGSVVLMWTHALHGVVPRQPNSPTRWTVVYGFRNPGKPSKARWISPRFAARPIAGAHGLMDLY